MKIACCKYYNEIEAQRCPKCMKLLCKSCIQICTKCSEVTCKYCLNECNYCNKLTCPNCHYIECNQIYL